MNEGALYSLFKAGSELGGGGWRLERTHATRGRKGGDEGRRRERGRRGQGDYQGQPGPDGREMHYVRCMQDPRLEAGYRKGG